MDKATEILNTKSEDKKQQIKNLVLNLLEFILTKKTLTFLKLLMKYLDTSNNPLKKLQQIKFQRDQEQSLNQIT